MIILLVELGRKSLQILGGGQENAHHPLVAHCEDFGWRF